MEKIVVLVNAHNRGRVFGEKYYEKMRKFGEVKIYDRNDFSDMDYVLDFVKGATVIVTSWASPKIDTAILDACPDLRAVIHGAGSIKPIISDEFLKRRIRISNSAVAIGEGVAETALAFAISACKGFYQLNRDTANGLWGENVPTTVKDFYDITVGIVSASNVGRHMIKLLKNFYVDIVVYDPTVSKEDIEALGAKKVELDELLKMSDVISLHAPKIPATLNMLNKDNIPLIRDGAVLINTCPGAIIEEEALIKELKTGRFFACLDMTATEPTEKDNPLRDMPNVVLTPHIAGTATNGLKRVALHVCDELERLTAGEKMRTEVNIDNLSQLA